MTYTVPPGRYSDVNSAFVQAYIDAAIAGVVDLAPETLNSLNELAAAINDDPAFYATIASQVSELNTDVTALNTALGIAENDSDVGTFSSPTLPDGTTLRAVLEAFAGAYDTTKTNLEDADTALSDRLDTLETDPTTQTAVDAKLDTANPAATGDLTVDTNARLQFDSNLTKVENVLRGTSIDIGNNIQIKPAVGYKVQIDGGLEMDNNAKITVGGGLVMRTSIPASPVDGDIYFDKTALALKIYVDDGNSQQWVQL